MLRIFMNYDGCAKYDVHNCEKFSDGGSASNSDAEPEVSDYDSDEVGTPATIEETVSNDQNESARNWQYTSPKNGVTIQHPSRKCSLTKNSEHVQTMKECFHLFINEKIMDIVIQYTNEKAKQNMPPNKQWKPVDHTELNAFFELVLLIGRFRESRERKQDQWKVDEGLSRLFYAAIMSQRGCNFSGDCFPNFWQRSGVSSGPRTLPSGVSQVRRPKYGPFKILECTTLVDAILGVFTITWCGPYCPMHRKNKTWLSLFNSMSGVRVVKTLLDRISMHPATENEYVSIIELLVEFRINVFERMKHESTLMHTASRWGAEIGAGFPSGPPD
ncbi:hypothetical protein K0M31_012045 [Melipona bicolor]|uniref:PiggyBac transposable element-derived protein domain-containing protein n=1 Tax=Melipona bicolor TaxID=60889 RepID=A0AA40GAP7_9HYME|nr:hypothetical protein K0M31_012045 [Melipona bicolor]